MQGILFGDKHTYDDWNLVLTNKSIGLPNPKTSSVDIEGADGTLDTTEVLGEVRFTNRTLAFEFTMMDDYEEYNELVTDIANYLHGKKLKIILDEDDDFYYYGRCQINQWASEKRVGKIVIYCDCEPYKYRLRDTVITKSISGTTDINITGERKTVNPIIRCTRAMQVLLNGVWVDLDANTDYEVPDIMIKEGDNLFSFKGDGAISFTFKSGVL